MDPEYLVLIVPAAIAALMLFGWWWNKDKPRGMGM